MSSPRYKVRWTKRGISFGLFSLLLLLASFNTGENLFYMVTGALQSFLFIAWRITRSSVCHVSIVRSAPDAVHRQEPFAYSLMLKNQRKFGKIHAIELQSSAFEKPYYIETFLPETPFQTRLLATMPRRGIHSLPALRISSSFPFGLFSQCGVLDDQETILVYPRVYPLNKSIMKELDESGQVPKSSLNNDGNEFYSLREYIPGDDIRHISWKISARIGKIIIRELEPSITRMVVLVLDTRGLPKTVEEEEQFEQVIDLAASLAVYLLGKHFSVGLELPDDRVSLSKGDHQSTRILEALTRLSPVEASEYPEDWYRHSGHFADAVKIHLATDSTRWGMEIPQSRTRTLSPEEVLNG